ncbi:MFS transporter [Catellatospora methionotrophica]|uniref:MFS transporter n=1 Tax=Catellatospora methionotrophica TaxID=121620 RepID=A0A8J3PFF6_9ACTN|nr:MFS transporter [Catellatospora methionotrophica]GIG14659.1 MFS transporter [Catellatospora methionotrophica]
MTPPVRRLGRIYAALRACDEGVLFFPVYALLMADSGLSTAQVTSLFVIWSAVAFALEVPSGAWADTYSRRRLLAAGALARAAGFAVWFLWPVYAGFAIGFVLWGVRSAISSGTKEALLYDELAAEGATDRYTALAGRAATVAMVSMLAASALAAPAYKLGGYGLVALGSVLACLGSAAAALALPERARVRPAGSPGARAYVRNLRDGLAEVRADRRVWQAVLIAAAVPSLSALDEYGPLLVRDLGVPTAGVPLVIAALIAAMALGSALAERWRATPLATGLTITGAGLALAVGALDGGVAGLVPIAVCFGLLQLTRVLTEARLQHTMSGHTRATVLSVSGFGAELGALAVYGCFGLGSLWLGIAPLAAVFAVPIVLVGLAAVRWLPGDGTARAATEAA